MANEADTCRKYVVPRLQAAGWEETPHSIHEQCHFTAGRIVVAGRSATRQRRKRADYLLRYAKDLPIAVVEAKADYKSPRDGLQQAREYAEIPRGLDQAAEALRRRERYFDLLGSLHFSSRIAD